jgi:hypothetical protein
MLDLGGYLPLSRFSGLFPSRQDRRDDRDNEHHPSDGEPHAG